METAWRVGPTLEIAHCVADVNALKINGRGQNGMSSGHCWGSYKLLTLEGVLWLFNIIVARDVSIYWCLDSPWANSTKHTFLGSSWVLELYSISSEVLVYAKIFTGSCFGRWITSKSCFRKLTLTVDAPRTEKQRNTVLFSTCKGWHGSGCPRVTSKFQWVHLLWKKEHNLKILPYIRGNPLCTSSISCSYQHSIEKFKTVFKPMHVGTLARTEGMRRSSSKSGCSGLSQSEEVVSLCIVFIKKLHCLWRFSLAVISVLPCSCWSFWAKEKLLSAQLSSFA